MTNELGETLRTQKRVFTEAGTESPALSAELLLAHALGIGRQELLRLLLMEPRRELSAPVLERFRSFTERRLRGEPVAYITGSKEFYGRDFTVTPATLIPRPETELIVDKALELFGAPQQPGATPATEDDLTAQRRFADFGTGSGCLAVTLALELNRAATSMNTPDGPEAQTASAGSPPQNKTDKTCRNNALLNAPWSGLALDISAEALKVAAHNAVQLGADKALTFRPADFTAPLPRLLAELSEDIPAPGSLDLLVSNPPYVSEADYRTLAVEVRAYEPKGALVPAAPSPAPAGYEHLPVICNAALRLLKPGGVLLMEIGHDQGDFMRELLANTGAPQADPGNPGNAPGWSEWQILRDLSGLERTVFARKK